MNRRSREMKLFLNSDEINKTGTSQTASINDDVCFFLFFFLWRVFNNGLEPIHFWGILMDS